jgi:hypothetical protein
MDLNVTPKDLTGWVPFRVFRDGTDLLVDWCYVGPARFTQPFFEDTIRIQMRNPFGLLFRHLTSFQMLGDLYKDSPGLLPTGFVFHLSRCGSTLVSQMLASLDENIVISEAPPIDRVIREASSDRNLSHQGRLSYLKWIIGALGQRRTGAETQYFIKFDCWNTLDIDLICEAFPNVPWIFLYRNPVEIMVSQMRERGVHTIPGAVGSIVPDLDLAQALQMPAEEYCAMVLARICESVLRFSPGDKGMFVNYSELPGAVTGVIAKHFGIEFSKEAFEKMTSTTKFHAKTPQMEFKDDSRMKQDSADEAVRNAAEHWLMPFYSQMEAVRNASAAKA